MKNLILFLLLFISCTTFAQTSGTYDSTKTLQQINGAGFVWKTGKFGTLIIGYDTAKLAYKDSGSIAYKGGNLHVFNGSYWRLSTTTPDSFKLMYPLQVYDSGGLTRIRIAYSWQDSALANSGGGASIGNVENSILFTKNSTLKQSYNLVYDSTGSNFSIGNTLGSGTESSLSLNNSRVILKGMLGGAILNVGSGFSGGGVYDPSKSIRFQNRGNDYLKLSSVNNTDHSADFFDTKIKNVPLITTNIDSVAVWEGNILKKAALTLNLLDSLGDIGYVRNWQINDLSTEQTFKKIIDKSKANAISGYDGFVGLPYTSTTPYYGYNIGTGLLDVSYSTPSIGDVTPLSMMGYNGMSFGGGYYLSGGYLMAAYPEPYFATYYRPSEILTGDGVHIYYPQNSNSNSGTMPLSINGNFADSYGNITIPTSNSITKYTTNGYGVLVDSTSNLYTIKADTNVTAKLRDAAISAIISSQWATSGSDIYYNDGNVGIGTTTPVSKLDTKISQGNVGIQVTGIDDNPRLKLGYSIFGGFLGIFNNSNTQTITLTGGDSSINLGKIKIRNSNGANGQVLTSDGVTTLWKNPSSTDTTGLSDRINAKWDLLGNTGTDSLVNYIGTNDNQALVFKVNGQNVANIGERKNVTFGNFSKITDQSATGLFAFSAGSNNRASGSVSIALGEENTARGYGSIVLGYNSIAEGDNSISLGSNVIASGSISTAIGNNTQASGSISTAMGNQTTASGDNSTAMGTGTGANGHSSTAMGSATHADGESSTAMGYTTTASGSISTAMGNNTQANGHSSTAMGYTTTASGSNSTAMGNNTQASGSNSTAMGYTTTASGSNSTAMGYTTQAKAYASIVFGDTNENTDVPDPTNPIASDRLLQVGKGSLSNAITLLRRGEFGLGDANTTPLAALHIKPLTGDLTPVIIDGLGTYTDDTDAGNNGLTVGMLYKTSAGVLMIKL